MILTIFIAVLVGFAIGVLSGLLGVGGGTVMVPTFRLAYGMDALASTATSLFAIIPTALSGVAQHVRNKTCIPKLGVALGLGGACLSPVGVWLAQLSPSWLVMVAVALAIGYSSITMLLKAIGAQEEARPEAAALTVDGKMFAKSALIGALAGLVSGYIGLGGGFLMVPLMVSLLRMPMRTASGTSLIAIVFIAAPAVIAQCAFGNVDYLAGIAVACGSVPGALVGARLVSRVPERALRFTFAAFLGVAAILLVGNELGEALGLAG